MRYAKSSVFVGLDAVYNIVLLFSQPSAPSAFSAESGMMSFSHLLPPMPVFAADEMVRMPID